jgi:hypothetical protein
MDGTRFDSLTRALGAGRSRRSIVKSLGKGLGAAAVGAVGLSRLGTTEAARGGNGGGGGGTGSQCAAYCSRDAGPGRGAAFAQCKNVCQSCGGPANLLFNCTTNLDECASETCQPSGCCPGTCVGTCCTC